MHLDTSKWTQGAVATDVVAVGLYGCASTPVPNEKIAVTTASVQRAEQAGAPEWSPDEPASARDKLSRAQKAAVDRNKQTATMLAEQANADAQLAEARAQQQRSHQAATEFDASMQALRQAAARSSSSTP